MDSEILFWLLIVTLASSVLLLLASSVTMGRKLAELEYQYAAGINGIKRIQSWMNVRTHFNRIFLALAFLIASVLTLLGVQTFWTLWGIRILLIAVLVNYTLSSILDWRDEHRQTVLFLAEERERTDAASSITTDPVSE